MFAQTGALAKAVADQSALKLSHVDCRRAVERRGKVNTVAATNLAHKCMHALVQCVARELVCALAVAMATGSDELAAVKAWAGSNLSAALETEVLPPLLSSYNAAGASQRGGSSTGQGALGFAFAAVLEWFVCDLALRSESLLPPRNLPLGCSSMQIGDSDVLRVVEARPPVSLVDLKQPSDGAALNWVYEEGLCHKLRARVISWREEEREKDKRRALEGKRGRRKKASGIIDHEEEEDPTMQQGEGEVS